MKFPLTINAVKKSEGDQWALGDALRKECGDSSANGVRDGSFELMLEVEKEILENTGAEYTPSSLAGIRATASAFSSATRRAGISFSAHRVAGSPEYLEAIIAGSPKGTKITQPYIEEIRRTQRAEILRERERLAIEAEQALIKAEQELEEARKAASEAEIKKAETKADKARLKESQHRKAPVVKVAPPKEEDVIQMVAEARFRAAASRSVMLAQKAAKGIEKCLDELSENRVRALTEMALEAANSWTDAAHLVRKQVANKRGHLSVFGK